MRRWNPKVRKFSVVDKEFAVFEVMDGDEILFDLTKTDDGVYEIGFDAIAGRALPLNEFLDVVAEAKAMLDADD